MIHISEEYLDFLFEGKWFEPKHKEKIKKRGRFYRKTNLKNSNDPESKWRAKLDMMSSVRSAKHADTKSKISDPNLLKDLESIYSMSATKSRKSLRDEPPRNSKPDTKVFNPKTFKAHDYVDSGPATFKTNTSASNKSNTNSKPKPTETLKSKPSPSTDKNPNSAPTKPSGNKFRFGKKSKMAAGAVGIVGLAGSAYALKKWKDKKREEEENDRKIDKTKKEEMPNYFKLRFK